MGQYDSRKISEDLKNKIIAALEKANANLPCPRCGNKDFFVADGLVMHILQNSISNTYLGGPGIVCAAIVCMKCGYIAEHAMGVLGLMDEVK